MYPDIDQMEADEIRAEDAANRRYERQSARHPDCRDPDHPGCENCEPPEDEEEGS